MTDVKLSGDFNYLGRFMNTKSNIFTHYFYLCFIFSVFISFTILQLTAIKTGKLELVWLIIGLTIELLLVIFIVWILRHMRRVSVTNDYIKLSPDRQISWLNVQEIDMLFFGDIYFLQISDKKKLVFVGDRFPFGFLGILMQENQMYQLIKNIKKKFDI
ncbi:MAG: hypothetical protein ACQETL_01030 [Bacteroidota bacterium]